MLRKIKWWLQNRPITKNGVLPVTTLFFWKFCFTLRTFYTELPKCPNLYFLQGLEFQLTVPFFPVSILNKHRFWHSFENCINPLCSCSLVTEDTLHYLLHCHHFSQYRFDLMISVKSVLDNFKSLPDNDQKDMLLYGDSRLDNNKNKYILEAALNYI